MIKIAINENDVKMAKEYLCEYFDSPIDKDINEVITNTKAYSVDELIDELNNNPIFNFVYKIQKKDYNN